MNEAFEPLQALLILMLAGGVILNAMATRRLIKAVEACTQLTVMAIVTRRW